MGLKTQIQADMQASMRNGDKFKTSVLRMLMGDISYAEKAGKTSTELSDQDVLAVLNKAVKQRTQTAVTYDEVGRPDAAAKERAEVEIISNYLPQMLSTEEVSALVNKHVESLGATSIKQMGQVVKAVLAEAQGRAEGKQVSALVKARLTD